jgi:hypothetical protein
MFSIFFFENSAIYEIMWKNFVELDRPQMTVWRKLILSCKSNAKDKHSEYVTVIVFLL